MRHAVKNVSVSFIFLALIFGLFLSACERSDSNAIRLLQKTPIQHEGRVKSFDAFARSTVKLITGKEKWQNKSSVATIVNLLGDADRAESFRWIQIVYPELKKDLGLPLDRQNFSLTEIQPSRSRIESLVRISQDKRNRDVRPSKLEQKAERLFSQIRTLERLYTGQVIRVIPNVEGLPWTSPFENYARTKPDFKKLITELKTKPSDAATEKKALEWLAFVHQKTGNAYRSRMNLEAAYLTFQPFRLSLILYVISFLMLTIAKKNKYSVKPALTVTAIAILLHTAGILLRVLILQRPPVSNMFESIVFMNWALMIFALVFSLLRRNTIALAVGSLVSAFVMIYSDLLPIDSSPEVLVPVLRSNYWLTIHVMTIVSSYGAFGLAMGLGHRHLILEPSRKFRKTDSKQSASLIYRLMQIGLLFLGIGTVLGGVWANESWGRFWGWDPKETWALITFLGYLIIIHLRHTQRLDDTALAFGSILAFLFVLMTWYGVNFVLGRGLHSYGSGSGGMIWIIAFLVLEGIFLSVMLTRKLGKRFLT